MRAVKKKIIIFLILFFILMCSFVMLYLQEPIVILKKKLVCEVNTECKVFEFVKEVDKGLIVSKNNKIDSSKIGTVRVILETKNMFSKKFYYSFQLNKYIFYT